MDDADLMLRVAEIYESVGKKSSDNLSYEEFMTIAKKNVGLLFPSFQG